MIEVIRAGALTTVQDHGRIGWAHIGVPRSGALDQPALDLANALVGNESGAAGLEITLTGCVLRFHREAIIAITGAAANVTINNQATSQNQAIVVRPAETLKIGPAKRGVRTYLAVRGGIDVPATLGSRSTDTLSALGPPPLKDATILPIGDNSAGVVASEWPGGPDFNGVVELGIRLGPRDDWFVGEAPEVLCGSAYTLTVHSNRIGARLAGAPLRRAWAGELPSEGIVLGSVQVTPDGSPLVFLADHPTTGGYPVIGVVDAAAVTALAQVRPGASVRFRILEG